MLTTLALALLSQAITDEDLAGGACFKVPDAFVKAQPSMARGYQADMIQDAVKGRAETGAPAFRSAPVRARLMLTAIWVAAKQQKFVPLYEQMEKSFTYDPKQRPTPTAPGSRGRRRRARSTSCSPRSPVTAR